MIRVNTKKLLLRYCDLIDLVVEFAWRIAAALLGLLMSALAVQIFRRTLFKAPIFGIEEGVTAAMVWFAALGMPDPSERPRTGGIFPALPAGTGEKGG